MHFPKGGILSLLIQFSTSIWWKMRPANPPGRIHFSSEEYYDTSNLAFSQEGGSVGGTYRHVDFKDKGFHRLRTPGDNCVTITSGFCLCMFFFNSVSNYSLIWIRLNYIIICTIRSRIQPIKPIMFRNVCACFDNFHSYDKSIIWCSCHDKVFLWTSLM